MAEFPAMPLWTDAYLGDTTHLTTIEHGAYLLLLMTAWRTRDCTLPDDDRLLARYARLNAQQWKRMRSILEPFFSVKDGVWRQGRLTDERGAVERHRHQQSEKGKAGAVAKSLKRQGRDQAAAKPGLPCEQAEVQPDASSHLHLQVQLDKSNCPAGDSDKQFWDTAKSFLGPKKASLIGKWVSTYGKEETAAAISAAQVERAMDPVEFIQGRFRKQKREMTQPLWNGMA
jgi:uncharacterized protein YdaU (DUF1376 family)